MEVEKISIDYKDSEKDPLEDEINKEYPNGMKTVLIEVGAAILIHRLYLNGIIQVIVIPFNQIEDCSFEYQEEEPRRIWAVMG